MVLLAVKFSLREASCCRLEVVNGGAGFFLRSPFFTPFTVNCAFTSSDSTLDASVSLLSSRFSSGVPA